MTTININKGLAFAAVFASGMLSVGSLQAASITYNLTLSSDDPSHSTSDWTTGNILNGNTYATVTIDNQGTTGLINFTVALSSYWSGKEDTGFGIDSFGFNVLPPEADNGLVTADIINLPTNWSALVEYTPPNNQGTAQNGFGKFDAVVDSNSAANRLDPSLIFSIDLGLDQSSTDSILDYIAGSHPGDNGSSLFAVHIAGFTDQNPLDPVDQALCDASSDPASIESCNLLTSVWVGGGTVVPVPAAVWLFGSGLLGLVGIARRKSA